METLAFTRTLIALAATRADVADSDDLQTAANYAARRWGEASQPADLLARDFHARVKTATVPALSTISGNDAADLKTTDGSIAAFFAAVREASLLGRIPGLRNVPMDTRLLIADDEFEAAWIGEGAPVPVSSATFHDERLSPLKIAGLCVLTRELIDSTDPAAEGAIQADLIAALSAGIDASFIDPSNAGTANVKPASATYGAHTEAASGDGGADLRNLIAAFQGSLERAVLIGSAQTFAALSDPFLFPLLGVRGGSALGIPAIAAKAAGDTLALIDPDGIAVAMGGAEIKISQQGTIEMTDGPTNSAATGTASTMTSMWQTNSIAVMGLQIANWSRARDGAVRVLTGMAGS